MGSDEFALSIIFDLEVFNTLHQIKSNAIGLDGVPLKFLKLILQQLLGIVTHIFNTTRLRKYYPLLKKANRAIYRVIDPSAYFQHSKAIEIIMKRQINAFLMDKGLLGDYQSGFRSHHGTSRALLKITNDLLIATDEGLVSLDFSRAFDSVNHRPLSSKLSSQCGFTTSAVSLIMSYLSDSCQCV
jgi:hypothetical protein